MKNNYVVKLEKSNLSKTLLNIQFEISENDFLFKKNELVNPMITNISY